MEGAGRAQRTEAAGYRKREREHAALEIALLHPSAPELTQVRMCRLSTEQFLLLTFVDDFKRR